MKTHTYGNLVNYNTTEIIRPATAEEHAASVEAAELDGGAGVIEVDGVRCYVEGDSATINGLEK